MDANITVMISLNKKINTVSSYFFDDPILGWAANENTKNRFKTNKNLWTLQSTYKWANKHINNNRINKNKNSQILIKKFFNILIPCATEEDVFKFLNIPYETPKERDI